MSRPLAALLFLPLLAVGLPHARGTCGDGYTVARGDTLYSIARLCRSNVAAIARASGLADARRIEIGQRLVIPGRRAAAPKPEDEERGEAPGRTYRIAPGDTLFSLARWSRVGLGALIRANPGIDPRKVEIGDTVRLPAGAADPGAMRARERRAPAPAPSAPRVRTYAPPPPHSDREPPRDDKPDDSDDPRRGPEGM